MKNNITFLLAFVFFLGLASCDDNTIYEENLTVEGNVWKSDDIKTFSFDVTDTISPTNIFNKQR